MKVFLAKLNLSLILEHVSKHYICQQFISKDTSARLAQIECRFDDAVVVCVLRAHASARAQHLPHGSTSGRAGQLS